MQQTSQHHPGELYAPESRAEYLVFKMGFCGRCVRSQDAENPCRVQMRAALRSPDEPGYPPELTYDSYGQPTCTEFENVDPEPVRCMRTGDLFS